MPAFDELARDAFAQVLTTYGERVEIEPFMRGLQRDHATVPDESRSSQAVMGGFVDEPVDVEPKGANMRLPHRASRLHVEVSPRCLLHEVREGDRLRRVETATYYKIGAPKRTDDGLVCLPLTAWA